MFEKTIDASYLVKDLNHNLNEGYSSSPFFKENKPEIFEKISSFLDESLYQTKKRAS